VKKLVATILFLVFLLPITTMANKKTIDDKCKILSAKSIEVMKKDGRDYTLITTKSFYSKKVDSCILIEVADVGVEFIIRDLSKSVIRDGPRYWSVLLYCDVDGANSAILKKVREFKGNVFNVPYREWLDDGFGGLPRTVKTPDKPYTKNDCEKVYSKWMSQI